MEPLRYFLDSDNSGHWYIVEARRRDEWNAWTNLDEDDEASWDAPDFAVRVNGAVSSVTFADPCPAD